MAQRKIVPPKFWPLLRLGNVVSIMLLVLTAGSSGAYWLRAAAPQQRSLQTEVQRLRDAAHGAGIGSATAAQVRAKLKTEEARLQDLQNRIPQKLTTLQVASFISGVATSSGAEVQSISFGATKPANGYQATSVSIDVLSPNPQATVTFLHRLDTGDLPVSTSVASLSLAGMPRTISIPASFYSEGGLH